MRYFKENNGILQEYNGLGVSISKLNQMGYIYKTNLTEPLSNLKIENNQIVLKTEQDLLEEKNLNEENQFKQYYINNPDLAKRVLEFKNILDTLNLSYNTSSITPEVITNAVNNNKDISENDKITYINNALSIWQFGIIFNLKFLGINNAEVFAFYNLEKLIKYLPEL